MVTRLIVPGVVNEILLAVLNPVDVNVLVANFKFEMFKLANLKLASAILISLVVGSVG